MSSMGSMGSMGSWGLDGVLDLKLGGGNLLLMVGELMNRFWTLTERYFQFTSGTFILRNLLRDWLL